MSKTVIFIHGAWLSADCWDDFQPYFEQRGYTTLAPNWPLRDASVAKLRANPPAALAHLGAEDILAHYERIICAHAEPPILIGHSFGGLFVQLLLDRGLGAAGVAIDPAAPKGVITPPNAIRSTAGVLLTPGFGHKVVQMTLPQFQFGFMNGLPLGEQQAVYEAYVVPESGHLFAQAVGATFARHSPLAVNFHNPTRAPLLLTAGLHDHTVPPSQVGANYRRYRRTPAQTDLLTFANRTHWLIKQSGWQEVADSIIAWLAQVVPSASASLSPASGSARR